MNCSNIRPLLSEYYDGDVGAEERVEVERHLAGCQECRRALGEYRAIGSDIRAMSVPAPPAGLRRDVWRAIEAQQAGPRVFQGTSRGVATTLPQPRERSFILNVLRKGSRSWAAALPAALLIGGLLLVLSVILLRNNPVAVASMVEDQTSRYTEPVHVQLHKEVVGPECIANTAVRLLEGTQPVTITNQVDLTFDKVKNQIAIQPKTQWEPGAQYQVYIDAPKVGLIAGEGSKLDKDPITLSFSAAAHTPTPTSTPTITPTPTNTPVPPTDTPQPTAVAENTAVPQPTQGGVVLVPTIEPTMIVPPTLAPARPSATRAAQASPTIRVIPTNTVPAPVQPTATRPPVQPTNTTAPMPTQPVPPTLTPVATATQRATNTPAPTATVPATPQRTATATATPTRGGASPTPTRTPVNAAPCDLTPVNGFGLVWQTNKLVRDKIGCPEAREIAVPEVAMQHFQGGLMVWRADLKLIYVFIQGAGSQSGIWVQFPDTWQETDTVARAVSTPLPPGLFEPVRGFGKLWNTNGYVRQSLGWATDQEVGGMTGAWQKFDKGEALWTSDRQIRFMYNDDTFQRFDDRFTTPGE